MKIKELIAELQKHDPELMVVIAGYEGGVNEVSRTQAVGIKLNVNTEWYYGKHEVPYDEGKADCLAIQIS